MPLRSSRSKGAGTSPVPEPFRDWPALEAVGREFAAAFARLGLPGPVPAEAAQVRAGKFERLFRELGRRGRAGRPLPTPAADALRERLLHPPGTSPLEKLVAGRMRTLAGVPP